MSHTQKNTTSPFDLDPMDFPFRDAIIVQAVPLASMLQWRYEGSGFFVETETKPDFAEFEPAAFVRNDSKKVQGFAIKKFDFFPAASRIKWEMRENGNRVPVDGYQKGARSKTNVLGIASDGTWLLVTATGLASKELNNAYRKHRYAVARQHNAASFAVAMACITGEVELIKESYVNKFIFVASNQRCPDELGWAVREHWSSMPVLGCPILRQAMGGQRSKSRVSTPTTSIMSARRSKSGWVRTQKPIRNKSSR